MTEFKLDCAVREKVGSRDARKLRAHGRMVASLQTDDPQTHVNLHFDESSFHTARRQHAHLFELVIDGREELAIVGELQWDAFGDSLQHVEFKRVVRGQKTESVVPLRFEGEPLGVLTHDLNEITILCIPSIIPDAIVVPVGGLEPGTHVKANEIELPDGIELQIEDDHDLAVITELKEFVEEDMGDPDQPESVSASEGDDKADGDGSADGDGAKSDG